MDDFDNMVDQLKLVEALHHIASESDDADTVRYAMGALVSTEAGRKYLTASPVMV